jgi:hypothetical protein
LERCKLRCTGAVQILPIGLNSCVRIFSKCHGDLNHTLRALTFLPRLTLPATFFSSWSMTISALSDPFSCRRRWILLFDFGFGFFFVTPALARSARTESRCTSDSTRGREVSDFSMSTLGEDARLAAREWVDWAGSWLDNELLLPFSALTLGFGHVA